MERRIYFVFGDFLACVLAGAVTGWLVHLIIPEGWNPMIAMLPGMAIGMLVGTLTGLVLTPFFGDLEVILPASFSGLLAGIVVGMWNTGLTDALMNGALSGLFCFAYTYILQARISGKVEP